MLYGKQDDGTLSSLGCRIAVTSQFWAEFVYDCNHPIMKPALLVNKINVKIVSKHSKV